VSENGSGSAEVRTKVCLNCGEQKPVTHFYHSRKHPDGLTKWCTQCLTDSNADIGLRKLRLTELIQRAENGDVKAQHEVIRRANEAIERGEVAPPSA
jgi:hypothetical protein